MTEPKTRANKASVVEFIESVEHKKRQQDAKFLLKLMCEVTGEEPAMWGSSIIGFGSYHYKYASGKEGEWMRIGFSPRKQSMNLYIMNGFEEYRTLLNDLGKHKIGKSCLYINKVEDIDIEVLKRMIHHSFFDAKLGSEK